jgi:hypothetical protein
MTLKDKLELAQFLWDTRANADRLSDRLDPQRKRATELSRQIGCVGAKAGEAFANLTGFGTYKITSITQLSTDRPPQWVADSINAQESW